MIETTAFKKKVFCMSPERILPNNIYLSAMDQAKNIVPIVMRDKFAGVWYEWNICKEKDLIIRTDYYDPGSIRQTIIEKFPAVIGLEVVSV